MPGFGLTYRDLGNTIHFSFLTTLFFLPSQKIMITKHNIKRKKNRFLNVNHSFVSLSSVQELIEIKAWLFLVFSICLRNQTKFYKFHWHMSRKRLLIKQTENEEWLLLSASFTAKTVLEIIFKIAIRLRARHVFYVTITENFDRFQYINFKTNFLNIENPFQKNRIYVLQLKML